MNEIVSRVSTAIFKASLANQQSNELPWEAMAVAAIQELRYPTHAMLDAGVRAVADASTRPSYDPVDTAWHAMIEEALRD